MSAPTEFGAPGLGPGDRIPEPPRPAFGLAWDDYTPAAWKAFGEPVPTRKENPMPQQDTTHAGNYNHRRDPAPQPQPQPVPEQKPEGQE